MAEDHYLKAELYELVRTDPKIFDFLQAGSLDGIWYWDLEDPAIEWMSERFWTTLGFDPSQRAHRAEEWQDLIHPDDLQEALKQVAAHRENPEVPYDQILRYRHADGGTVWVRCRGLIIRDEKGRPKRMLGAHTEVTALKQAEAYLSQAVDDLRVSNADLEQFASVASHDLQQPLRAVRGFVELLVDEIGDDLSADATEYVGHIQRSVAHMQALIDGVLGLSRVGAAPIRARPLGLRDVVEQAVQHLAGAIAESGGEVVVGDLPPASGDATLLVRLFQNLIGNGLKFRMPGRPPVVRVEARPEGDTVVVTVADNGRGLDERFFEEVFQLFRRVRTGEDSETDGIGAGLPTARRIARLHGGDLTLASTRGEGTCLTLVLPVVAG